MSFKVRTQSYSGPFDLLLQLVTRQKVTIGSISISEVANQYLAEVERMEDLDLDVASDFVLVASTLLDIKAASLVPAEPVSRNADVEDEDDADLEGLSPDEAREVLIARLIAYKQFRSAGAALGARLEFLLEAEHIAPKRLPVALTVASVDRLVRSMGHLSFSQLLDGDATPEVVVVNFLAILDLFKRGMVTVRQDKLFGDIEITHIEGADAYELDESVLAELDEADAEAFGKDE